MVMIFADILEQFQLNKFLCFVAEGLMSVEDGNLLGSSHLGQSRICFSKNRLFQLHSQF